MMHTIHRTRWTWRILAIAVSVLPLHLDAAEPRLPDFSALRARASDSVVISLDSTLLGMAGQLLDPAVPADANLKAIISGLKSIEVRSFSFEKAYQLPAAEIAALRAQLNPPAWHKMLTTHSAGDQSDVDVYMEMEGQQSHGLVIIASQPREFTVVSIVGAIDLARLRGLEGHLGVPKLPEGK